MKSRVSKSEVEPVTEKQIPRRNKDAVGGASPFATVREAAEWLRVSERTIRRWIKEELLPCDRFGRNVRITWEDLKIFAGRNLRKKTRHRK